MKITRKFLELSYLRPKPCQTVGSDFLEAANVNLNEGIRYLENTVKVTDKTRGWKGCLAACLSRPSQSSKQPSLSKHLGAQERRIVLFRTEFISCTIAPSLSSKKFVFVPLDICISAEKAIVEKENSRSINPIMGGVIQFGDELDLEQKMRALTCISYESRLSFREILPRSRNIQGVTMEA